MGVTPILARGRYPNKKKDHRLLSAGSARNPRQSQETKKPQITQIKKIERQMLEDKRAA